MLLYASTQLNALKQHQLSTQTDLETSNLITAIGMQTSVQMIPERMPVDATQLHTIYQRIEEVYRQLIVDLANHNYLCLSSDEQQSFDFEKAVRLESEKPSGLLYSVQQRLTLKQLLQPNFITRWLPQLIADPAVDIIDQLLFSTIGRYSCRKIYEVLRFYAPVLHLYQQNLTSSQIIIGCYPTSLVGVP